MKRVTLKDFSNQKIMIAPSLLAADFARLAEELQRIEPTADMLHLDIMDGHFVPNLSFGPPILCALREETHLLFDVHLMLTHPADYVEAFAKAGAGHITFHIECAQDPLAVIQKIHDCGCTAGISLKPKTAASSVIPFLDQVEMVLVMSVEPGFGGQSFMPEVLPKTRELRNWITQNQLSTHVQIDGGIDLSTAPSAIVAGANILVAGTAIFRSCEGADAAIAKLKQLAF